MILITMVDTGGYATSYLGTESKSRLFNDRVTAIGNGYKWYKTVYEAVSREHHIEDTLLSEEEFESEMATTGCYVTIQAEDFHIQFEYAEISVTEEGRAEENTTSGNDEGVFFDVYFHYKPLVKVVEAKNREEARQIAREWGDTSIPRDELVERFLAAVDDTDSVFIDDVVEAPVIGTLL